MKNFNTNITKAEAKTLINTPNASFKNTDHNKKMVANSLREVIAALHNEAPKYV